MARKLTGGGSMPASRAVLALLLITGTGGDGHALDRVRAETGVDLAVATLGVSGEGVIVAIMDRGIDWQSNDFRNDDGTTRIAYIFDLSDDTGAAYPDNAYGRGTIYTRQQIDQALIAGTALGTRDAVGHGTATTGIAAGNGRNLPDRKYRGVAPNATIISVKVTGGAPAHGNEPAEPQFFVGVPSLDVAVDFVLDKARELSMPVVMLLNLGSIGGPSDGTSALSRKIDESVGPDHPGVVFVTGTGDDGVPSKTQNRAAADVPSGGSVDLRFALDNGAGRLEAWYDENRALDVSIDTPTGMLGPYRASQFHAADAGVRVYHHRGGDDFYGSANGKRLLLIDFDGASGAGEYTLRLDRSDNSTESGIHIDATLSTPYGESGRFLTHVTPGSIWDGATAFRNVAPNSYVIRTNWTDIDGVDRELADQGDVGQLWTGSSIGPTVDGRFGVDVSAPGDRVVAPYAPRSYWATLRSNLILDGGELYGIAGAVSAAAPVVTGIIALMLELDPTLDAVTVKRILQQTARTDEFTGQTPNALWGYGKVDANVALMAVRLRTLDDGSEGNDATYEVADALPGVPTSGWFVPAAFLDGSVLLTVAGTTISLDEGGYFDLSDGTRYTCTSVDGCTVANGTVTRGAVTRAATGGGDIDRFPTFRASTHPGDRAYTVGTAIDTLTLPEAGGGNGVLRYGLSPAVPGLVFDAATRELSSTPGTAGTYAMIYTVVDEDGDADSLGFTVTVGDAPPGAGLLGMCRVGMTLSSGQSCIYPGTADEFSVNVRGRGSFLDRLAGIRIQIDKETVNGRVYDLLASHLGDGVWRIDRIADSTEPGTVGGMDGSVPRFADGAGPGGLTYTVGAAIGALTLPEASGGAGTLRYGLSPRVPGLAFDAATRELSGTPSVAGDYDMTYTAIDEDGDADSLTFAIAVENARAAGDFGLASINGHPRAIDFANGRFHVVDSGEGKLYAYAASGERDTAADFDLDEGNADPSEIAFANGRFHVVNPTDVKVHAYTASGERESAADFDLDVDNGDPSGIAFGNGRCHVVDLIDDKVCAYTATGQRAAGGDSASGNADLAVASPTVSDSDPSAGGSFTLSATVRNDGGAEAPASTLRFYRSADSVIGTGDTEVGTNEVDGLAAFGTGSQSIGLSAPFSRGTYYYGACVDAVANESDTANNCSSAVRVSVTASGVPAKPSPPPTHWNQRSTVENSVNVRLFWDPSPGAWIGSQ